MAVESVTYISDLVNTNPDGSDPKSDGDNHIRNLKTGILNTFPNIDGAISASQAEINKLIGVDETVQEKLDQFSLSISNINSQLSSHSLSLSAISSRLSDHSASISQLHVLIDALSNSVSNNNARISTLSASVSSNNTLISLLSASISAINTKLNELSASIADKVDSGNYQTVEGSLSISNSAIVLVSHQYSVVSFPIQVDFDAYGLTSRSSWSCSIWYDSNHNRFVRGNRGSDAIMGGVGPASSGYVSLYIRNDYSSPQRIQYRFRLKMI